MKVVTSEALEARPLAVRPVPDAFGRKGGCYVRGYTDAELELMTHAATRGGVIDYGLRNRIQLAQTLLTGPDPTSPRLLGAGTQPTRQEVELASQLPGATAHRLVQISDDLAGVTNELVSRLTSGWTGLSGAEADEAPASDGKPCLPELDTLFGGAAAVQFAESAFGELGGVYVREYGAGEVDQWELLGTIGSRRSPRRVRWAKLAACLVLTDGTAGPVGPQLATLDAAGMEWIARHVWPGEQLALERLADALSGWSAPVEARLREAELPLPGRSSEPGPSPASTVPPTS